MDRILLHDIGLTVHLGVSEEERRGTQRVYVDLELGFDTRAAGKSDDFTLTVDYAAVYRTVRRVAEARAYALVESMAEQMAKAVLAEYPVEEVRLRLRKPEALRAEGAGYAGVEIVRRRGG